MGDDADDCLEIFEETILTDPDPDPEPEDSEDDEADGE